MQHIGPYISMLVYALCAGCGRVDRVVPPDVKVNPTPHERQRFVISVTGQSGQMDGARGRLQYNIADDSCVPVDYKMALGGIKPTFTMYHPLKIVPTERGTYEGHVYQDLYESSDYYGLGVCRWKLTAIVVYIIRNDGKRQSFMLNGIDLEYGSHSYATCPTGSPRQYSLNCAFSRSHPMELTGDFYTLSVTSGRD